MEGSAHHAKGGKSVRVLESRKSLALELADLLVDGKLEIYPHVEEMGLLFMQFRGSKLVLSAGPFVGLIPLTPKLSIEVRPKMPVSNLARVLDTAKRPLSALSGMDRFYVTNDLESSSILQFLATNLVDALHAIQVNGLLKEYLRRSNVTSMPRGRIELDGSMRLWARGQHHLVKAQRFEQSSDIAANRVIKYALRSVLIKLKGEAADASALIATANKAYSDLPSTISEMIPADFAEVQRLISQGRLPPNRTYYARALEIALLILSNRGISLQEEGKDVLLETFIVNFEVLFEEYLRRVLHQRAPTCVRVRDGSKDGKKALFDDVKQPSAQPDIVIHEKSSGRKMIAEVKYKDSPNRDDINQAIAYGVSYRSNHVVLVHQKGLGAAAGLSPIGTVNGIKVESYAYDLSNPDLDAEEAQFAEKMLAPMSLTLALAPAATA